MYCSHNTKMFKSCGEVIIGVSYVPVFSGTMLVRDKDWDDFLIYGHHFKKSFLAHPPGFFCSKS